jgi:hypothetical protein
MMGTIVEQRERLDRMNVSLQMMADNLRETGDILSRAKAKREYERADISRLGKDIKFLRRQIERAEGLGIGSFDDEEFLVRDRRVPGWACALVVVFGMLSLMILGVLLACPARAMPPQQAWEILGDAQLVFYRNFVGGDYTFNGFLDAGNNPNAPNLVNGHIFPNGQGLFSVPDLSLGECVGLTMLSYMQLTKLILTNAGGPYGPEQHFGGCADATGDVPEPGSPGDLGSCSSPNYGAQSFAYENMNPLQMTALRQAGATCGVCVQGPGWYPCQAGLIGCANPPIPGTCTPFHF